MAATPSNDAQAVEPASNESNDQENTNNQQPAQPQRQGSFLQGFIWRLVIFWFISNLFRRGGTPGRTFKNLFEKGQQLVRPRLVESSITALKLEALRHCS